jgi:isopentenyl-diphosphate delta-isomerase, type 1
MMPEYVQLVDENDRELGIMEKMEAHVSGSLHRAVSIFVFNSNGDMVLQQRASSKYHSPGLWSNTCCTHPRPGESPMAAAERRLLEEMGMTCPLVYKTNVRYRAEVDHGLTEYELDHIFIGVCDTTPVPNPQEVASWCYVEPDQALAMVNEAPGIFTTWFPILYEKIKPLL